MRLMPDYNFSQINTITTNSTNPLFPALNLLELDPAAIWRAASFSVAINLVFDLGSAKNVDKIWLNNANFINATLQANSSDSWNNPAVSKNVALEEDDIGVVKGYFALSNVKYRYVRILIPMQSLLFGTAPQLGNVIIGKDSDFSPVSEFNVDIEHDFYTFTSDAGSFFKKERYKPRHVLNLVFNNMPKAEIAALPLTNWNNAILFTDFSPASESYLVYPPISRKQMIRNPLDCSLSFAFEELV